MLEILQEKKDYLFIKSYKVARFELHQEREFLPKIIHFPTLLRNCSQQHSARDAGLFICVCVRVCVCVDDFVELDATQAVKGGCCELSKLPHRRT